MPDEDPALVGDELGVELADLYRCGRVSLPNIADRLALAVSKMPGESLEWPFRRGTDVGLGDSGPYNEWRSVADLLVHFMTTTETNLRLCGEAMVRAANDYAATDAEARAELERRRSEVEREAQVPAP